MQVPQDLGRVPSIKFASSIPLLQPSSATKHSGIHKLSFPLLEIMEFPIISIIIGISIISISFILLLISAPPNILFLRACAFTNLHDPQIFMTDLSLSFGVCPRYVLKNPPLTLKSASHIFPQCNVPSLHSPCHSLWVPLTKTSKPEPMSIWFHSLSSGF